jgi:hypothetical protein
MKQKIEYENWKKTEEIIKNHKEKAKLEISGSFLKPEKTRTTQMGRGPARSHCMRSVLDPALHGTTRKRPRENCVPRNAPEADMCASRVSPVPRGLLWSCASTLAAAHEYASARLILFLE